MSEDGSCSDSNVSKKGSHLSDLFANGVSLSENDSFYLLNRVAENFAVLQCSKKYLALCTDFDKQVPARLSLKSSYQRLPADLQKIEDGIDVLCVAYAQALKNADFITQNNIRTSILSLSSIYENKTAEAYFSATSVVLDAYEVADKPEVLKQLVDCRNSLQKLHSEWPIESGVANLSLFNKKVELYGKQIGINGQLEPEKVLSSSTVLPQNFISHVRCA